VVALTPTPDHVLCRVDLADVADLTTAISRCRRLLDLDADPEAVDRALGADPALAPLVRAAPGRRVPRTVDGAEFAVRAVLGQQVSTAAARTTTATLVAACGEVVHDPIGGLTRLFPTPDRLAGARPGLTRTRRRTFASLVDALSSGRLDLGPGADRAAAREVRASLPGIGPWTVEMVAMRALGDPDAFPESDLGVRRGAGSLGLSPTAGALWKRSIPWRPWRAYAVQHLWAATDHPVNSWPPPGTTPVSDRAPRASERRADVAQKETSHA
jgi:AraC family transcriptional regulator of adaptative response / DNA-3-methyladenine glycosylase II